MQAFGQPAAMSLPARIVGDDDLLAANAFLGAAEQSAIVFGPLVAAVAISAWGIRAPFLFDAATFVAGAVAVAPVHLRPVATVRLDAGPVATRSARVELREGLVLARSIRDVRRALALAGAVFFTWGAFFVLEPLYVRDVLHRSAALLGLFQTVFGVGLVATTLMLPALGDRVASLRVLSLSVALSGLAAATYVGTRSVFVAFVGVFLWGVDVAFFLPPMQTVLQRATPVEAHGRVLGLASTLEAWGSLIAIPLTGLVVASIGVSRTGAVVGAVAVAARSRRSRSHPPFAGLGEPVEWRSVGQPSGAVGRPSGAVGRPSGRR